MIRRLYIHNFRGLENFDLSISGPSRREIPCQIIRNALVESRRCRKRCWSPGLTKLVPSLAAVVGLLLATFGWTTIIHRKLAPLSVMGVLDSVFMAFAAMTVGVLLNGDTASAKRLVLLGTALVCVLWANFL
jgi:hypothetical protein